MSENKEIKEKSSRLPELIRVSLLYDYYGTLLSEKQKEAVELYYLEDHTLGEIAKTQNVSRQAVFDALHHAIDTLEAYEAKLGLVKQQQSGKNKYADAITRLRRLIKEIDDAGIIYDSDKLVNELREVEREFSGLMQENEEPV